MVPRFFYVPRELIELEQRNPGSQPRIADKGFNLWGQSVYLVSQLLLDSVITANDIDPIRRHVPPTERTMQNTRHSQFVGAPFDLLVQVVLLAESTRLQTLLSTYGIQTQTPHQVEPVQVWAPSELVRAHQWLGECSRLGLSGRPTRPFGILSTSKFYRIRARLVLCYPILFEIDDFYIAQDTKALIGEIKVSCNPSVRMSLSTSLSTSLRYYLSDFQLYDSGADRNRENIEKQNRIRKKAQGK